MPHVEKCPECGAEPRGGLTCHEMFLELLRREFEDPACGSVHPMTVLCYNLQHPTAFSEEALVWAQSALHAVVEQGMPPAELRRRAQRVFETGTKPAVLKGGQPAPTAAPRRWSKTTADVIGLNPAGHCQRVTAWAKAVLKDLDRGKPSV